MKVEYVVGRPEFFVWNEKRREANLTPDNILKLAQTAAIVIGGLWAFFEYQSFKKEDHELTLAQQRLATEMAKLSITASETSNRLSAVSLKKAEASRLLPEFKLGVKRIVASAGQSGDYEATVSFRVTNMADRSVEVSWVVLEWWYGHVRRSEHSPIVQLVNRPEYQPTPRLSWPAPEGGIEWSKVSDITCVFAPFEEAIASQLQKPGARPCGLATGNLAPDETTWFENEFAIRGRPGDFVAFGVTIGIDRAMSGDRVWLQESVERLPSGPAQEEGSSGSAPNSITTPDVNRALRGRRR